MADLDVMDGKLDDILQNVATINQRCVDRLRILDGHGKTLYGEDGTGGLVAKQNEANLRLKNMNGVAKDRKDWAKSIIAPVIAALIISVVVCALFIWKTH